MSKRGFWRWTKRIDVEWMVVRKGCVLNFLLRSFRDGRPRRCLPLFRNYEHARLFIGSDGWAAGARPCRIGSTGARGDGSMETLGSVIAAASLGSRCECAAVMEGTTADGVMRWRLFDIRAETLGLSGDRDLA